MPCQTSDLITPERFREAPRPRTTLEVSSPPPNHAAAAVTCLHAPPMRTKQGFVRKRVLPVVFPAEGGAHTPASPIRDSSSVAAEAGNGQGPLLLLHAWGGAEEGEVSPPPPDVGSKIVDRAAEGGKVGALVKASSGKPRGEREH